MSWRAGRNCRGGHAVRAGAAEGAPVADPGLAALRALVEPDAHGGSRIAAAVDNHAVRTLADELAAAGHKVSPPTVARLLKDEGFSLQANVKVLEGRQHPDRDLEVPASSTARRPPIREAGDPVISVDAKKKELVGQYKKAGRAWRPTGKPEKMNMHKLGQKRRAGEGHPVRDL